MKVVKDLESVLRSHHAKRICLKREKILTRVPRDGAIWVGPAMLA
jgi:hypothetical protein